MSSAASTDQDKVRLKPDTTETPSGARRGKADDQSLQPWQFFVLAALGCATAATFMVRGQGLTVVILLTVLMGTAALVAMAMLNTVLPLVSKSDDRAIVVSGRTRATLERDKLLTMRALKELEFDRAMGKVADDDFREMTSRLRERAMRLMRALDAGAGYRDQIERDVTKRLGDKTVAPRPAAAGAHTCASCSTVNDADAKFCKGCGQPL